MTLSLPWLWLGTLLFVASACSSSPATVSSDAKNPDASADSEPAPPAPPRSALSCEPGKGCPPCVDGKSACASRGPFIEGTCCAVGDNVRHLAEARGSEVVDIETDGTYLISCGGFGADISKIAPDPSTPTYLGTVAARCQRIAFGPKIGEAQIFYIAHHGDSWVPSPELSTYRIEADGTLVQVDQIKDTAVLFEGLLYHKGLLYCAAHGGGVRVYGVASDSGAPKLERVVKDGVSNAWKLAARDDWLFVADAEAGLLVYSLADADNPQLVATLATSGNARDVAVRGARAYVALGGAGVDVIDISDPAKPALRETVATRGSAQAVSASDELLAIAAWNHVALHDAKTLALLGVEKTRAAFEQDLGVAIDGDQIYVGEWEGMHVLRYVRGLVGPSIWIEEDIFTLDPKQPSRAVIVENLGVLPLGVRSISLDDAAFTVVPAALTVAPGQRESFEFSRAAPAPTTVTKLRLDSNDPDARRKNATLDVEVRETIRIGIGDSIAGDKDFSFLDPAGQVANLRGKVIVIAYFALF